MPSLPCFRTVFLALAALLGVAGCASTPEALRGAPEFSPDVRQVRAAPESYLEVAVRWGGVIVAVENRASESVVEVVSRPLSRSGRPRETDQTFGRFLAHVSGFLDPAVYAQGREFTVVGRLHGLEPRTIGGYAYTYPLVRVTAHHLWPPLPPPPVHEPYFYRPPYYRWPYYDPWYPYGPYPYRY